MSNIRDLHRVDLEQLIYENSTAYNSFIGVTDDVIYNTAFELMQDPTTSYKNVDKKIVLWLLAYNALQNNVIPKNKIYNNRELDNLPESKINKLAKALGMKKNNIENIKQILFYMDKLHSDLDIGNKKYYDLFEPLLLNSDFNGVINLLKAEPGLRSMILKLIPQIIQNNIDNINNNKHYDTLNKEELIAVRISKFVENLIDLNQKDLVRATLKAIKNIKNTELHEQIYYGLFLMFVRDKYLDIVYENIPDDYDENLVTEIIDEAFQGMFFNIELYYLIHETLKYAIKNNKEIIIEYLKDTYDYYSKEFTESEKQNIKKFLDQSEK
jgi:hypothetical protein